MRRVSPTPLAELFEQMYGLDDYKVEWATGLPLPITQQDAAFYKDPSGSWVCTVSKDGFVVDIYCDGEMSVRGKNEARYSYGSELIAAGYTDATISGEELDWSLNPWFDLYVRGEHLDAVSHDIVEALNSAKVWLEEEIANAHQIEEGLLDLPAL